MSKGKCISEAWSCKYYLQRDCTIFRAEDIKKDLKLYVPGHDSVRLKALVKRFFLKNNLNRSLKRPPAFLCENENNYVILIRV